MRALISVDDDYKASNDYRQPIKPTDRQTSNRYVEDLRSQLSAECQCFIST